MTAMEFDAKIRETVRLAGGAVDELDVEDGDILEAEVELVEPAIEVLRAMQDRFVALGWDCSIVNNYTMTVWVPEGDQ